MCPDRKLKWFQDKGCPDQEIQAIRQLVVNRWTESYKPTEQITALSSTPSTASVSSPSSSQTSRYSKYSKLPLTPAIAPAPSDADTIEAYLAEPVITGEELSRIGGVMKYWYAKETNHPSLARMASDFCSAPGMCP